MKKTILISSLCFIFSLSLFSGNAQASVISDFSLNNVSENPLDPWRRLQFDRLALDVVIPANDGNEDSLNALSIMNLQSARYKKGIEKLILWSDDKTAGFQGMGIDSNLGEAIWDGNSFTWYWNNLDVVVPAEGLRIFISVELENDIDDNRTVQLVIPKFTDNNDNGIFDFEDKGIFMSSGNNGPVDLELSNSSIQTIRSGTADPVGPKSVLTNLFDGDEIELGDFFVMTGLSKDQGNRSVNFVQISIVKEGDDEDWEDISTDKYDFADWSFSWSPVGIGNYEIKIKSRDLGETESITEAITVIVVEKEEEENDDQEEEIEDEDPEEEIIIEINNGDLVRAAGDYKVYIINRNCKRWIQSAEVFNFYEHFSFTTVKEISKSQLENYTESWLIRADGDKRVYEINADGTKHWLNITAEGFTVSGRSWDMVYIINNQELDFYTTGADITK